jgi:hypothetical protein
MATTKKPPKFRVGDRVRIADIAKELKDPNYDRKLRGMRTAELFRFCLGRVFTIRGFDRYGNVELHVSRSPAVRKKFGKWHWIWSQPDFLNKVTRRQRRVHKV